VLAHRLIQSSETRLRGKTAADLIAELVATVAVPVEAL
jgi:hypothetical protein